MKPKCQSCNSCGMPMENQEDFALGNTQSIYCKYCTDKVGQLLSYDVILKNNAEYYQESQGLTSSAATRMAQDLLKTMPAWQDIR